MCGCEASCARHRGTCEVTNTSFLRSMEKRNRLYAKRMSVSMFVSRTYMRGANKHKNTHTHTYIDADVDTDVDTGTHSQKHKHTQLYPHADTHRRMSAYTGGYTHLYKHANSHDFKILNSD